MTEQVHSDFLSRLRDQAQAIINNGQEFCHVRPDAISALVECAEELDVLAADCEANGMPLAAASARAVLKKLEVL